jgi:hypothetical protein
MNDLDCQILEERIVMIISFGLLCLGISEAYFVVRYNEFNNQCGQIWLWALFVCVFDIGHIVFNHFKNVGFLRNDGMADDRYEYLLEIIGTGRCVVSIWSAIIYHSIDDKCYYFWTSQAPQLWTFVVIHYCLMSIGVLFVLLAEL